MQKKVEKQSSQTSQPEIPAELQDLLSPERITRDRQGKIQHVISVRKITRLQTLLIKSAQASIDKSYLKVASRNLGFFSDTENVLKCGGRLNNSNLDLSTKHPILLLRDHPLTNLIIWQSHRSVMHNGVKETLTDIRLRFWVVKGRQLVKKIIRSCKTCIRIQGLSYGQPGPSQQGIHRCFFLRYNQSTSLGARAELEY